MLWLTLSGLSLALTNGWTYGGSWTVLALLALSLSAPLAWVASP